MQFVCWFVAAQRLVKMTSALQKSECCSAVSAVIFRVLGCFLKNQTSTEHANREIWPTNSLTKVLMKMHTGVYTKMSTEMPTKVEGFFCASAPEGPHEDSPESAHGKFSSAHGKFSNAHENVHESVLGQIHMSYFQMFCFLAKEVGEAPANETKERSVHELFTGAFRNKISM